MPLRDDEIQQVEQIVDRRLENFSPKKEAKVSLRLDERSQAILEDYQKTLDEYGRLTDEWKVQFEKDKALSERLESLLPELEKLVDASKDSEPKDSDVKKSGGKKK